MIVRVTNYKEWEKPYMDEAVEEYSKQHPEEVNGIHNINIFLQ
jgi:hypothetical protein